jgi:predicted acylesterase/phospholipase RssA
MQMEEQTDTEVKPEKPIIKHIVCSGGGLAGFAFYGALKQSHKQGLWQLENIQTIYGTSVGTIIAVMLALKYDWDTLDDYLIKRPWQNVFTFNLYSILDTINKRGMFGIEIIQDIFLPLFNGKDIRIDITLIEFYKLTNIEIHMCATDINTFQLIDISHKTHPDWNIIEAIYSSCSVPVLFTPLFKNNECYCDGGVLANYPLEHSIKNGANPNEILGIRYKGRNADECNTRVTPETTLFGYALTIINRLIGSSENEQTPNHIANEYDIWCPSLSIYDLIDATNDSELRLRLIQQGIDVARSKA